VLSVRPKKRLTILNEKLSQTMLSVRYELRPKKQLTIKLKTEPVFVVCEVRTEAEETVYNLKWKTEPDCVVCEVLAETDESVDLNITIKDDRLRIFWGE
jgi:hypothetical protein